MSTDLFSLEGKRALVTGGAQGLGRMIAEGLLRAGASVTITSRKADTCEQAASEMSALGACEAMPVDLTTPAASVELVAAYGARHGRCDILVNNAGKTWGGAIDTYPDKAWADVMAVNVQTPFTVVREMLPLFAVDRTAEDPARVINIGSVAGKSIQRLSAYSYAASKAAIHLLSRELAADLAERHITVNAVLPGYFPTKMTAHMREGEDVDPKLLAKIPLHRLGHPDDIAGIVVFLASRAGSYVTGAEIPVDGGLVGCV